MQVIYLVNCLKNIWWYFLEYWCINLCSLPLIVVGRCGKRHAKFFSWQVVLRQLFTYMALGAHQNCLWNFS